MSQRYDILETLGEGGAGAVFKAWDKRLQRYVAIKRLHPPEKREGDGVGTDLLKEASALSSLQHPNIVSVYDLDEMEGEPCVVMEFLNGETLEQTMRRGALTLVDFASVARQALEGLIAAHRLGVQHRDLKPSNIMVSWLPNGDFLVKMLDFGLADFNSRPHEEVDDGTDSAYGSVHFMAPEQFQRQPVDVRTDIYSLGCVLYYALTASYPFDGKKMSDIIDAHLKGAPEPIQRLRADVQPVYAEWVAWLMSKDPKARPQSAEEALEMFRQIQSGAVKHLSKKPPAKVVPAKAPTAAVKTTSPGPVAPKAPAPGASRPAQITIAKTTGRVTGKVTGKATGKVSTQKQSRLILIGAIAAAGIAILATVLLLIQKKKADVIVVDVGLPPAKDPMVWAQASLGTRTNKGETIARLGDKVDVWQDQAAHGGANHIHYVATTSREPERTERLPLLVEANAGGIVRQVLRFDGLNCLLMATEDKARKFDPSLASAAQYSVPEMTYAFVLKPANVEDQLLVLAAGSAKQRSLWELYFEGGKLCIGDAAKKTLLTSVAFENHNDFLGVVMTISSPRKEAQVFLTDVSGNTAPSPIAKDVPTDTPLQRVRLGARSYTPSEENSPRFKGDIAEILVYDRILTQEERKSFSAYFVQKYGK